jgi:uncharacterized membrane protein
MTTTDTSVAPGEPHGGPTPARKPWIRPSWAGVLLLASLSVNLLVLGAAAGAFLLGRQHGGPGLARHDRGLMGYVRTLPAERRRVLMADMQELWSTAAAGRNELRRNRHAVLDAYIGGDLDRQQLEARLDGIDKAETAQHAANRAVLIAMVAKLTPQERKGFRDWLAMPSRHDHGHRSP